MLADSGKKKEKNKVPSPLIPPNDTFSFGCDPELFIKDKSGKIISAAGLIPGTKEEPFVVEGGSVQVDGMAAEFGIDPAKTFDEWNDRIVMVMKQLKAMLPAGHTLHIAPIAEFDEQTFIDAPDEAKILGCDPDFNAWTMECNTPVDPAAIGTTRTASGHVHIGWDKDLDINDTQHRLNCRDLVRQLDFYLGGWSAYKLGSKGKQEEEAIRRQFYGQAGAHRVKPYGVEYRVLSNFWLTSKTDRLAVWNRMCQALSDMARTYYPERLPEKYNTLLRNSIQSSILHDTLRYEAEYPICRQGY